MGLRILMVMIEEDVDVMILIGVIGYVPMGVIIIDYWYFN